MGIAEAMDNNNPVFQGQESSLVDFIMAPWAVQLWVFDYIKTDSFSDRLGQNWTRRAGLDGRHGWLQLRTGQVSRRSLVKEMMIYSYIRDSETSLIMLEHYVAAEIAVPT